MMNGKSHSLSSHPRSSYGGSVPNLSNTSQNSTDLRRSLRDQNRAKAGKKSNRSTAVPSTQPKNNNSRPNKRLELEWVHGYSYHSYGKSLFVLLTGELLYSVAAVAVLYHRGRHRQRHYLGHTEDIQCIAIHPFGDIIATAQGPGTSEKSQAHVRLWRVDNLVTLSLVGLNRFDAGLITMTFSSEGSILLAIESRHLSLWDWLQDTEIGRASIDQAEVLGCAFLPFEMEMAVTYGHQHLTLWRRGKDGVMERQELITSMSGFSTKSVLSLEILPDNTFLTGDSDGYVTVWAHSDDASETYFIRKEFKAHKNNVTAVLLLPGGLLLTGNGSEREGEIRIWNANSKFAKLMSAKLPPEAGEVRALCPQISEAHHSTYYVGTSYNVIFEGSVQGMFTPIIHGHQEEISALAVDPYDAEFVTVGVDKLICKWDKDSLLWKVLNTEKCISVSIYPESTVVAVGEDTGNVVVLNLENGDQITRISIANSSMNSIAYSPDGSILAAGADDGNVYLYLTQNDGCKYTKGGIMKGSHPILILDWSKDGHYIQTVVSNDEYHELVFWDIKAMHAIKDMPEVEQIDWQEITCTLGHSVFGIWSNQFLKNVINISCHRSHSRELLATGDRAGFVRIFQYPCTNSKATYFELTHGSTEVTAVRFLSDDRYLVSTGGEGVIVWRLEPAYY